MKIRMYQMINKIIREYSSQIINKKETYMSIMCQDSSKPVKGPRNAKSLFSPRSTSALNPL
jgi:hypothetical protein